MSGFKSLNVCMKYILIVVVYLLGLTSAMAQRDSSRMLLEAMKKSLVYYVDLGDKNALAFRMGEYYGAAPRGYTIVGIDTLVRQPDSTYIGKKIKIIWRNRHLLLIRESKNKKEMVLTPVVNIGTVNEELNNAYYLDRYLAMSKEIDQLFPMYDYRYYYFNDRYNSWERLKNKRMKHSAFRIFADERIKYVRDSIVERYNHSIAIMNYLIQNVSTIDYVALRDSLAKLPIGYSNSYYKKVVNTVARNKPEFFFRLAEDYTFTMQSSLFDSIGARDKEVLEKLKSVEGHEKIKKAFFKDIKYRKTMPIASMGLAFIELVGFIALMSVIF